jgi:photosynthetic reaction center H subunit
MSATLTSNIDLAEILFTLFWVFFVGLIIYLRREDKREGYPLESDRASVMVQGFPAMPSPKSFSLAHGGMQFAPSDKVDSRHVAATPAAPHPGAPLLPSGNPMLDGVGPASYAQRSDTPDLTLDGSPRVVPMRVAADFSVSKRDADPRGMSVVAADGIAVGAVADLWVDRSEPQIFYLEVQLTPPAGNHAVLLPFAFADVSKKRREIKVDALYSYQFGQVPALRTPDQVTLLEEDKITSYYAGGLFYADAARQEPLL